MLICMMAKTRKRQGMMTMTITVFTQMILLVMTTMTVTKKCMIAKAKTFSKEVGSSSEEEEDDDDDDQLKKY